MRSLALGEPRATTCSTRRAPAAGGRPSTSRPPRLSWRPAPAACRQAREPQRHRPLARPTCSRPSACASTFEPEAVAECIEAVGFGFMFAPPPPGDAARDGRPPRASSPCAQSFNFLGPLTNPAGAGRQLLARVPIGTTQETIAEALVGLGSVRAMVVAAEDGSDELSDLRRAPGLSRLWTVARRSGLSSRPTSASRVPRWLMRPAAAPRRTRRPSRGVLRGGERPAPRSGAARTPAPRSMSVAPRRASQPVSQRGRRDGRQRRCGRVADEKAA